MAESCELDGRRCAPCEGGAAPLEDTHCQALLAGLAGWDFVDGALQKTFGFRNHYEAMAFVNALAWISHRENHHPEVTLGYKDCRVRYWTHAINGLSENDFICAAKAERLLTL